MRGKKSYNIRNVEAHLHNYGYSQTNNLENTVNGAPCFLLNKKMPFQNIGTNNYQQTNQIQQVNEYVNAKYGVSKYASNLVSGKMFKPLH